MTGATPTSGGVTPSIDRTDSVLAYATAWFTYHAQQRLQSFNFFVVFQGALIVAVFGKWSPKHHEGPLLLISVAGIIVSIGFLLLEIRNTELVENARATLDKVERVLSEEIPGPTLWSASDLPRSRDKERLDLGRAVFQSLNNSAPRLLTHSVVLRFLLCLAIVAWTASLVRALVA